MANECVLDIKASGGTLSRRYSDESVTERFRVRLDTASRSLPTILNLARAANPTQFPLRGQAWPAAATYGLYADNFQFTPVGDLQKDWHITVTYMPLKPGEPDTEGDDNPLNWPATYSIEWAEREEAVVEARNIATQGQSSPGGTRNANTLGPLVNSAGEEFEESVFRTVRRAVLSIHKNIASLDQVLSVEANYADTTNSDTVYGIGPRRYMYYGVESSGVQTANGINYYARTIRVMLDKTTDRYFNNVGWNYCTFVGGQNGESKLTRFKVKASDDENDEAEVDSPEPQFLLLSGLKSTTAVTIGYRALQEVPYASLLI
jgi:hypothetical protein